MEAISYVNTATAASILHMSTRRVVGLCREGKIDGARQVGRFWKIPEASVLDLAEKTASAGRARGRGKAYETEDGRKSDDRTDRKSDNALRPCAIGNTSFAEIVSECYYVDKTLLIRDLIDDHSSVMLFARPRRFGKTLTINMLKTFFEKTEEDTSEYFQDKMIWQCGEKYRRLQGAFPVIMLTFKDVKYNTWQESMEAIRLILKEEYKRHSCLLSGEQIGSDDRDFIRRMESGQLSDVEYSRSLLNLVRMLSIYHQSKVIILIDEYDTPIQQGYARGFYQEILSFMRTFLSGGLKDNPDLAFGVLTGIMRISKENLFSGLNNLTVNTVLDEKYSSYFGFTEEEVRDMADYYGVPEKIKELRSWYDGYLFGETEIYNPWSVTNYFAGGCKPRAFWANTSDNEIIREILHGLTAEIADELTNVMQGKEILTSLNMEVIYPAISEGTNTIFSFLLLAGYLTPVSVPEETDFGTFVSMRLPNTEIRRVYNTEILAWLRGTASGNILSEIEKAIYLKDSDGMKKALEKYMLSCISSFDGAAEGFYHGMVLGLAASLSSRYYIRSNRESGEGRFDLQLEPKNHTDSGIIMELKAADNAEKDRLASLAEEALKQISDKKYAADMKDRGITDIVEYGIAFAGKHVEVLTNRS